MTEYRAGRAYHGGCRVWVGSTHAVPLHAQGRELPDERHIFRGPHVAHVLRTGCPRWSRPAHVCSPSLDHGLNEGRTLELSWRRFGWPQGSPPWIEVSTRWLRRCWYVRQDRGYAGCCWLAGQAAGLEPRFEWAHSAAALTPHARAWLQVSNRWHLDPGADDARQLLALRAALPLGALLQADVHPPHHALRAVCTTPCQPCAQDRIAS